MSLRSLLFHACFGVLGPGLGLAIEPWGQRAVLLPSGFVFVAASAASLLLLTRRAARVPPVGHAGVH